jgi:hypothetical protein
LWEIKLNEKRLDECITGSEEGVSGKEYYCVSDSGNLFK